MRRIRNRGWTRDFPTNDKADAEAICDAVSRPSMRFFPVKSKDTQALLMTHKAREFLVRQQTQIVNASC
jgi:transposase